MFLPINIYIVLSIAIAGWAMFHGAIHPGIDALIACLLFIAAGGGLKSSLWSGEPSRKIGGPVVALLICALADWIAMGFSASLFGYDLSGPVWGWIGFAITFVFTGKPLITVNQENPRSS